MRKDSNLKKWVLSLGWGVLCIGTTIGMFKLLTYLNPSTETMLWISVISMTLILTVIARYTFFR